MPMAITPVMINQRSVIKLVLNHLIAPHRCTGVSAKGPRSQRIDFGASRTIPAKLDVITGAVIIIKFPELLSDKVGQFPQYVIGNSYGPCISLETVLSLNHSDELGGHVGVGFLQCRTMNASGTSSHGLGTYRITGVG